MPSYHAGLAHATLLDEALVYSAACETTLAPSLRRDRIRISLVPWGSSLPPAAQRLPPPTLTPGVRARARSSPSRCGGHPFFRRQNGDPHNRTPRRLRASSATVRAGSRRESRSLRPAEASARIGLRGREC